MIVMGVDTTSAAYHLGEVTSPILVVVVLLVWASRSNRSASGSRAQPRTPELDMAVLATVLTIQAAHDAATALVTRALVRHPLLERLDSALPTWCLSGGHLYLTLIPTPAGSVLRIQEVALPLPSPQPAMVWEWALAEVQQEAGRAQIATYRGQQGLAPSRVTGPDSAIWSAVG